MDTTNIFSFAIEVSLCNHIHYINQLKRCKPHSWREIVDSSLGKEDGSETNQMGCRAEAGIPKQRIRESDIGLPTLSPRKSQNKKRGTKER